MLLCATGLYAFDPFDFQASIRDVLVCKPGFYPRLYDTWASNCISNCSHEVPIHFVQASCNCIFCFSATGTELPIYSQSLTYPEKAEVLGGVIFRYSPKSAVRQRENFGEPVFQVSVLVLVPKYSVRFIVGKNCRHRKYNSTGNFCFYRNSDRDLYHGFKLGHGQLFAISRN